MKEKIKNYFKNFIKTRNAAFYVAFAFAVITFVFGLVATLTVGVAGVSATAVGFTAAGLLLFVFFAFAGHEWIGAASAALAAGGALVAIVCECYSFFLSEITEMAMGGFDMQKILAVEGLIPALVCIVGLLICGIIENIFVYLRLKKKDKKPGVGEDTFSAAALDENNVFTEEVR